MADVAKKLLYVRPAAIQVDGPSLGLSYELREAAPAKYPFAGTRPMAHVFAPDGSVVEW